MNYYLLYKQVIIYLIFNLYNLYKDTLNYNMYNYLM